MKLLLLLAALVCVLPCGAFAGNWTVTNYTQTIMMDINMVSPTVGFIAAAQNGEGSNVVKTTDGGLTWTELNIRPAFMLMASAASSETSAIVGGVSILSGSVQYTTDGETFVNASEPHVLVEQVQSAYTIGGTDGQGYAVVGAWQILNESAQASGVAVSGDGGASFSIIDIANDNPARFGAFPDASNFFLTFGTFPNTSSVGQPITRNIHVHSHGLNGCSIHRQRKHKAAPSDSGAWLAQIMRTTDGGVTWDLMFNDDTFYFNQIACPSTSVCFAVGENDSAAFVYRTQDAGETWDIVLNSPGMSLMAVEALSETEVYIGGGVTGGFSMVGSTFYTSDAGATWNQTQIPDVYIMALSFPDADHGFATALNVEQQSSVLIYA